MKSSLALITIIGISCLACASDNAKPSVIGTWKLIEQLADPGDGSGTFQPVESNKQISFFSDSTFASNGPMCAMDYVSNNNSKGTFSFDGNTISPENCNNLSIRFTIDGDYLIIYYPCIEPCKQKYIKIQKR